MVGAHVGAVVFHLLVVIRLLLLGLHLLHGLTLLLLQVRDCLIDRIAQQVVPFGRTAFQPSNALVLLLCLVRQLVLVLEAHLLHLFQLLLVELAVLVMLLGGLIVEELAGGQAEQALLVRGSLPAGNALVIPPLFKLLLELLLQLVHVDQGLRPQQEAAEVGNQALEVIRVILVTEFAVPADLMELVEGLEPLDVVQLMELLLHDLVHLWIVGLQVNGLLLQAHVSCPSEVGFPKC
mmetsp:Transcript_126242/g.299744  ORF Transcript_126242/g.299744 Transcript_126242/m.299744 type:complete len:236 (-) Transcript_126242:543-1250(-)